MRYKVGDTVQVRQWDDMAREFGIINSSINCCFRFVPEMREYCGRRLRIVASIASSFGKIIYSLENGKGWSFSEDMFERVGLAALVKRRQRCLK